MNLSAKWRKIIYWATVVVTFLSAILAGLAAAFGIVTAEAVETGVKVAGLILGLVAPFLALKNLSPDPTDE